MLESLEIDIEHDGRVMEVWNKVDLLAEERRDALLVTDVAGLENRPGCRGRGPAPRAAVQPASQRRRADTAGRAVIGATVLLPWGRRSGECHACRSW